MVFIVSQTVVLNKNEVGRLAKAEYPSFTRYMIMRDVAMQMFDKTVRQCMHCDT